MPFVSAVCLRIAPLLQGELTRYSGFSTLYWFYCSISIFRQYYSHYCRDTSTNYGLFIVGVVLSYAYLKTNSLYLSIGLHAGWIFFN
ncbi:CPBP family intramembrane glutamic endopeptidase [Candidatus Kuenenia stuttgartensis]|uniref:CPBP family glutamic-type intramembrane protease n=1 Tax=Kuenenia stuttgartiensis TaxID=174633 RepID=UPI00146D7ECB